MVSGDKFCKNLQLSIKNESMNNQAKYSSQANTAAAIGRSVIFQLNSVSVPHFAVDRPEQRRPNDRNNHRAAAARIPST